jgi:excisionase family DNA binding protein
MPSSITRKYLVYEPYQEQGKLSGILEGRVPRTKTSRIHAQSLGEKVKKIQMEREAYTTSDIAHMCHHSRETVKRWLERGEISGYRVGKRGHWRVLPRDVAVFLKRNNIPFPDPAETGIDLEAFTSSHNEK